MECFARNSKDLISYTSTLKAGWPAGTISNYMQTQLNYTILVLEGTVYIHV